MSSEARGAVFQFEDKLVHEVTRHAPEVHELWVRWVPRGDSRVPNVHFVGHIDAPVMQRCAQIAHDVARRAADCDDLGQTSFHQKGERSPGDLQSKPALVWIRAIETTAPVLRRL